jgi:hypothetical protein
LIKTISDFFIHLSASVIREGMCQPCEINVHSLGFFAAQGWIDSAMALVCGAGALEYRLLSVRCVLARNR